MIAFGAGDIAGFLTVTIIVALMSSNDALKDNKKRHVAIMIIIFLSGIALFVLGGVCASSAIITIGALLIMTPNVDIVLSMFREDDNSD